MPAATVEHTADAPRSGLWFTLAYLGAAALAVVVYLGVRAAGGGLVGGVPAVTAARTTTHGDTLAMVLLSLTVVIVASRVLGALFARGLGQPAVIGEILAGIALGPSLLGAVWPEAGAVLVPSEVGPYVKVLAQIGVVLFMFLVGLELDLRTLRRSSRTTLAVAHGGIVVPFVSGAVLALWLFPRYGPAGVDFTSFSLFLGVSMSVTAFPVLARILTDRGVHRTPLGTLALASAAVDDVSAWTLLAFVVGVASGSVGDLVWMVPALCAYIGAMVLVVRPLMRRLSTMADERELDQHMFAAVIVLLLLSAWVTESIGIHALFGAFLLGVVTPHEGRLAERLQQRIEDIVLVLLLPAFFVFTGMRTQVGLVSSASDWAWCAVIVAVATFGKLGGVFAASRAMGLPTRSSVALGVLMNTRGLMELIVLNIGLDLGVISPTLFAMLVIMALVTTIATGPLLRLVLGRDGFADARVA